MKNIKNLDIEENVDMSHLTTYKLKGSVKYVVYPLTISALTNLIKVLKEEKTKYFILGFGSNVIFEDSFYDGVIIKLTKMQDANITSDYVEVSAGYSLPKLTIELAEKGLSGLEFASGIPGTIGGAIYQNAGAYNHSMSDVIEEVTVLNEGEIETIKKEDLHFGYRTSLFMENKELVIISAKLKLEKGNITEIKEKIQELIEKRRNTQPLEFPNAGSVFKNPENESAGKLIDDLGLKGVNINDASVSIKHANFIINKGFATGKDIIGLINIVKEKVKKEKNITLHLEQEIIK